MSTLEIRDRALALELAGGKSDLADELFAMLLRELPDHRSALLDAFVTGNLVQLLQVAHKLNGSATYTGVPALKKAVDTLERHLKRGEAAGIGRLVGAVIDEIDRVAAFASDLRHAEGF